MMSNFWSIRKWSRLPKRYGANEVLLHRNQRNILFSLLTLAGALITILHGLGEMGGSIWLLPIMDFVLAAFILLAYFVNEWGHHLFARIFLLGFLNAFFFLYSLITPREMGIYLFYFPWAAIATLVFERDEQLGKWFFAILPMVLLSVLFATDFNLLASYRTTDLLIGHAFVVNLLTSMVVTAGIIYLSVSMHEEAEERYRRTAQELQVRNEELRRSNEELDRFVYSASHDLKVPIASIKGLTHVAQRDCADPLAQSYFARIETQTDRLAAFLLGLFEFSRNQRLNLRPDRVNLSQLVDELLESLQHVSGAERIEFKKFIRVAGFVKIDRLRLMVILNNLITNAIQYHNMEEQNPWVKIIINRVENVLQITVADNGVGIQDEFRDKIFDMFFRAADRPIGNGLGLFIVKETVEKMSGKIMLSSNPGGGACFRIDVPLMP